MKNRFDFAQPMIGDGSRNSELQFSKKDDTRARIHMFAAKTGEGAKNLLNTSLDDLLAAMGALNESLPCRYDCNDDNDTAVSSGTQVPVGHGGTLNRRPAASHLMRLGEREERWKNLDHSQSLLFQN
ncbi:hypothetical protein TNCV_1340881 [Trichonephila clavipes]|nr:hypothetical protein TNCV_1340881 [Trichonephila clavipes]